MRKSIESDKSTVRKSKLACFSSFFGFCGSNDVKLDYPTHTMSISDGIIAQHYSSQIIKSKSFAPTDDHERIQESPNSLFKLLKNSQRVTLAKHRVRKIEKSNQDFSIAKILALRFKKNGIGLMACYCELLNWSFVIEVNKIEKIF